MKDRILTSEVLFDEPLEKVFNFFAEAENLEAITPPFLGFNIVTPLPLEMKAGAILDYKLRIRGIPIRWRTRINDWNPPNSFEDQQMIGPYSRWIHTHTFAEADGGTLMKDQVIYQPPGWIFEPIIHSLFVEKDLLTIFNYRIEAMAEHLKLKEVVAPVSIDRPR